MDARRWETNRFACALARIQGWFYLLTGIWPLVAGNSFQRVTGFKTDFWLAQTVGFLLTVSGLVMIRAARKRRVTPEIALLATLQAAGLIVVDISCVQMPGTTRVYLLDAMAEIVLVLAWLAIWRVHRAAGKP